MIFSESSTALFLVIYLMLIIRSEEGKIHYEKEFNGKEVTCPTHWGGYLIQPLEIEFWQGCTSRLHDRILFRRNSLEEKNWETSRLSP